MAVITSPVVKIIFVVAEIICKEAMITSSVAKITFVVAVITPSAQAPHYIAGSTGYLA